MAAGDARFVVEETPEMGAGSVVTPFPVRDCAGLEKYLFFEKVVLAFA
jgi:hypothetical protein